MHTLTWLCIVWPNTIAGPLQWLGPLIARVVVRSCGATATLTPQRDGRRLAVSRFRR